MRRERTHTAVAAAAGIGYLIAGVALLLQELGMATVPWSLVVPLVLLAAGIALLVTARPGGEGRSERGRESRPVA